MGGIRTEYITVRVFWWGLPDGKRQLGKPRHKWKNV
jgi:hypothetical protein